MPPRSLIKRINDNVTIMWQQSRRRRRAAATLAADSWRIHPLPLAIDRVVPKSDANSSRCNKFEWPKKQRQPKRTKVAKSNNTMTPWPCSPRRQQEGGAYFWGENQHQITVKSLCFSLWHPKICSKFLKRNLAEIAAWNELRFWFSCLSTILN